MLLTLRVKSPILQISKMEKWRFGEMEILETVTKKAALRRLFIGE